MGLGISACPGLWDMSCFEDRGGIVYEGITQRDLHLKLRVDASPIRQSAGTFMHNFKLTDEFKVEAIDILPGMDPLCWRHERSAQSNSKLWPGGPRCTVPMHYVRARVAGQCVLLVVANAPELRTMERVLQDIEDAKDTASYAHSFNAHLMRTSTNGVDPVDDSEQLRVRVCVPIGCRVLSSAVPQFAQPGAVVMLMPFPTTAVVKFVFDGTEEFMELPQAFFHYVTWMSGGRESLFDIQGFEGENGEICLIDPCVVRSPKTNGVSDFVRPLMSNTQEDTAAADSGPSQASFDAMHPKCGQLCKSFDPQRRGAKARKMCGLNLPSCGLGP